MAQISYRYDGLSRLLHHITAAAIVAAFVVILTREENMPSEIAYITLHKSLGITVLMLAAWRILRRLLTVKTPPYKSALPPVLVKAGAAVHGLLYLLMLAVPMAGWALSSAAGYPVSWFNVFTLPPLIAKDAVLRETIGEVHETLAWVLAGVVALHVASALYHAFIRRDGVLRRMWP